MGGRGRNSDRYHMHEGKQGKHIPGHNNYIPGRSTITVSKEKLQQLFNEYKGTGEKIGNKEVHVNFNETIGQYVNQETGESQATSWGTIHYDNTGGWHIVPEMPGE